MTSHNASPDTSPLFSTQEGKAKLSEKLDFMRKKGLPAAEIVSFARLFNESIICPPLQEEEVKELLHEEKEKSALTEAQLFEALTSPLSVEDLVEKYSAKIKQEEASFTRLEKLYSYLTKNKAPMSSFACCELLGITSPHLSNLLKEDEKGEHLIAKTFQNRIRYLSIRRPSVFQILEINEENEEDTIEIGAALPANITSFLDGGRGGLPKETYFGFCGYGDWGKSQFLVNCAIANAEQGRKVLFVRHEADIKRFYRDLAARFTKGGMSEAMYLSLGEIKRLLPAEIYSIRSVVSQETNLDDFVKGVREYSPDLVVYDYLAQEYMTMDAPVQNSKLRMISNFLANNLVQEGIPLLTATQMSKTDKGFYQGNDSWKLQMHICLEYLRRPDISKNGTRLSTVKVVKCKDGPLHQEDYIRWEEDCSSYRILKAWDATEEVNLEIEEAKKKKGRKKKENTDGS